MINYLFLYPKRYLLSRTLLLIFILPFCGLVHAQVTIGSEKPPHEDALLDLKQYDNGHSDKGLLIPRLSLTSTTAPNPLVTHTGGMIVYNYATAGDVTPGLYYNNGQKWIRAISAAELPPIAGTWFKQGTTDISVNNADAIWHLSKVSIGSSKIPSTESTATLFVDGDMAVSGKYYTSSSVYADYVFDHYFDGKSDLNHAYKFKTLKEVKDYIYENKHLPGVTKITDLNRDNNGYTIDMTSLMVQQLEKIEELYLHIIELNDKVEESQKQNKQLTEELQTVKTKLGNLQKK